MSPRYLRQIIFAILIILMSNCAYEESSGADQYQMFIEDLIVTPNDFRGSNSTGMSILPEGMTPDSTSLEGSYTSPVTRAPIPFNAVVPQWKIDLPEASILGIELRTGKNDSELSEWVHIHPSRDWTLDEDDDIVGNMLVVPSVDSTHEYIQYRITMERGDLLSEPLLRELRLTFIDSTAGLSVEEMILKQKELNLLESQEQSLREDETTINQKPFVISRDIWCTDPACNYTDGLTYQPVTHLILHHTVTSTGEGGDSAAVVRAIWVFHTSGRGWRDIGYNFLVDPVGVIFEGHLGGDDVVGIHASGANSGSMALAMLGDYRDIVPFDKMVESAVDLFSWKAEQKNIDVFEASDTLPNIGWGLPHLMGHRDVYGTTQCPGDKGHNLIPAIRDEVAARIGLVSPHIYVDELSSQFHKGGTGFHDGPLQCGHNTHAWYSWSSTDPAQPANWGEWRLEVPESGQYEIEVYAPYCNTNRQDTSGARYTVEHAQGASNIVVDQNDRIGLWTSLGQYELESGGNHTVRLTNRTDTDSDLGVWFDSIRLLLLEPTPAVTLESPANGSWLNQRQVTFNWQIDNPDKVKATVLQVATDEQFQNRIVNEIWSAPTLTTTVQFSKDYGALYWRVIVVSHSGKEFPSAAYRLGIDTEPPASSVNRLYWFERNGWYQVFWQGNDTLSGVDRYNIDYRLAGSSPDAWNLWLSGVVGTTSTFLPPDSAAVYEFRSQARDRSGNVEAVHSNPDISTDQAIPFSHDILLPTVVND